MSKDLGRGRLVKKWQGGWISCDFTGVWQWIPEGTEFENASECDVLQAWFPSTNPSVSVSISPSSSLREFGNDVTNPTITGSYERGTNPVSDMSTVEFFRWWVGWTLINTDNSPSPWDASSVFQDTFVVSSNQTYTVRVTDGQARTWVWSRSYSFVYPYYFGVWAAWLTPAQVAWLTKIIESQGNKQTTTSPINQVYYFAYPSSYGTLTSILDENGFEVIGWYTLRVENLTGLDWTPQSYNIYEWNNITTQTNFLQTYIY